MLQAMFKSRPAENTKYPQSFNLLQGPGVGERWVTTEFGRPLKRSVESFYSPKPSQGKIGQKANRKIDNTSVSVVIKSIRRLLTPPNEKLN